MSGAAQAKAAGGWTAAFRAGPGVGGWGMGVGTNRAMRSPRVGSAPYLVITSGRSRPRGMSAARSTLPAMPRWDDLKPLPDHVVVPLLRALMGIPRRQVTGGVEPWSGIFVVS